MQLLQYAYLSSAHAYYSAVVDVKETGGRKRNQKQILLPNVVNQPRNL